MEQYPPIKENNMPRIPEAGPIEKFVNGTGDLVEIFVEGPYSLLGFLVVSILSVFLAVFVYRRKKSR